MAEIPADDRLQELLVETSRTFALSIPVLGEPLKRQVTLAYLLFRIADTFEDAATWPKERRIRALRRFGALLEDLPEDLADAPTDDLGESAVGEWLEGGSATEHEGYLDLLQETPGVLAAVARLDRASRGRIVHHTQRTIEGMVGFVERSDGSGRLELRDFEDLEHYCYVVAGIVGELLTDLFLLHESSLGGAEAGLRARAATFGEALQLVNILKDAAVDLEEGRRFLPEDLDRERVFRRARSDLAGATEYVALLQEHEASRGTVAFTALPVLLARSTLDLVEAQGPGAKVERGAVMQLVTELNDRLDRGAPALG